MRDGTRNMMGMVLGAGLAFASPSGCKVNDGGDEEGGESTGSTTPTCGCQAPEKHGRCQCEGGPAPESCFTPESCQIYCQDNYTVDGLFQPFACSEYPDSGGCSGWSPSTTVRLVSGVRKVDDVWLANLIANPAPLWTCDNALLDDINGGGFKVLQANSGELLYELGLRNNDIPLSLNGMPLLTVTDGFDVFAQKYQTGVLSYTLVVKRGTTNVTISYLID